MVIISILPTTPNESLLQKHIKLQHSSFKNTRYSILIDYTKPILKKRLWVIDNENQHIVMNTHVSHAYNSGLIYPSKFSNKKGSNLSSIGVFKTKNSYKSNFGNDDEQIGMRIEGLDKGKNDNVLDRNIVFHCNYLFWSKGCFMTLPWINKKIIDLTKNGSLVYVYYE